MYLATTLSSEDKLWIIEQMTAQAAIHADQLHAVETKLLTAFHGSASPNEARQRTHAAALRAVDLEMESLHDRVVKLEAKA